MLSKIFGLYGVFHPKMNIWIACKYFKFKLSHAMIIIEPWFFGRFHAPQVLTGLACFFPIKEPHQREAILKEVAQS